MGRSTVCDLSVQDYLSAGGSIDTGYRVETGGLAGSVGAEKPEYLRAADIEAHIVHSLQAAEIHA
jgi:hypothetical protein